MNARFLEVRIKQPFGTNVDAELRRLVGKYAGRGRIELDVMASALPSEARQANRVDETALTRLLQQLALVSEIGLKVGVQVCAPNSLECLKILGNIGDPSPGAEAECPTVDGLVEATLREFVEMRRKEGLALEAALVEQIEVLERCLTEIRTSVAAEMPRRVDRLRERMQEMLADVDAHEIDPSRLAQEAALVAARSDVCEEVDRIGSHLGQCRDLLIEPAHSGQGKKLDFLAQELLRELSTLGTKMPSLFASGPVLAAKMAVERVREQAQNVE